MGIMAKGKLEFEISGRDRKVGYLSLPKHPGAGGHAVTVKQVRLLDLCTDYKGPDIYLDFDKDNCLIGIEILG